MDTTTHSSSRGMISWIALALAVLALILAWTAYNRAGVDLEAQVEREVDQALVELGAELEEAEREVRDETADTLESGSEALEQRASDTRTDENDELGQ